MGVWLAAMLWVGQAGSASSPPPPSPPSIRIGTLIFADYTVNQSPKVPDADGQPVTLNQFNLGRTYVNVTGSLSRRIAFRVTPEVTRETGTGTSLNGSYTLRLKFAYVQWNTDGWMPRGSSVRFGMQPTPWNEFIEPIYRYRFQGRLL